MNRCFIRIIAFIMAPCFLADPGKAFVAPAMAFAPIKTANSRFENQALSLHFISSVGAENLRRIAVFRRLGNFNRRFGQSPFAWALLAASGMIMGFDVPANPPDHRPGDSALKDATELVVGKTPYPLRIIGGIDDNPLFYATPAGVAVAKSALETPGLAMLDMRHRNRTLIDSAIEGMRRVFGLTASSAEVLAQQALSLLADLPPEQLTRAIEKSLRTGTETAALLQVRADMSQAGIVSLATGMETLVSYFNAPDATGGNLIKHINQALADPERGPGSRWPHGPIQSLADIRAVRLRHLHQWKTTLVLCMEVDLVDGHQAKFLVNIPKDVTLSGSKTMQTERILAEDFELNPAHVIRTHGIVQAPAPSWFGHRQIPLHFGEWLAKAYNVETRVADGALLWELRAPDNSVITLSATQAASLISQTNIVDALYSRIQPRGVLTTRFLGESKDVVAVRDSATEWRFILIWNQGRNREDYSAIVTRALFRFVMAKHKNSFALARVGKPDAALRDVREGLLQQLRGPKPTGTSFEEQQWGRQADAALVTLTKIAYEQAFPRFMADPRSAIPVEAAKDFPIDVLRATIAGTRGVVAHFLANALREHIQSNFRNFKLLTPALLIDLLAQCGASNAAKVESTLPDHVYLSPIAAARLASVLNSFGSMENLKPFYEAGKRGMNPSGGAAAVENRLSQMERLLGIAQPPEILSRDMMESWEKVAVFLHQLKLLNLLDVLVPDATVFNLGGGADELASIFGSRMYSVDNRLVATEAKRLFGKLWGLLMERLPELMATLPGFDASGPVVHEKDDLWAPGFIDRWANRMRSGDIVLMKHLQDYISDGNRSDRDNADRLRDWVATFAAALPVGVLLALFEPLPLCAWDGLPVGRRTLTELFLETGLFENHLGPLLTRLNPAYEKRLDVINQNNTVRGFLGLTEPHVGNAVVFRAGGALHLIAKLNEAA